MLQTVERKLCFCLKAFIGVILLFLVGINVVQVITRYAVNVIITWVEEISILGIIWIAAVGVPLAWFTRSHLEMDITDRVYSEGVKKALWWLVQVVCVAASIALIRVGFYAARVNKGLTVSLVGYDESFRYLPLIVCGFLLLAAAVFKMAEEYLSMTTKKGGTAA